MSLTRGGGARSALGSLRAHWLLACTLGALSLLFAPRLALASEPAPARVLLVADDPESPLIRRLSAEISVLNVTLINRKSAERLDAAAREEGAVAAIRVIPAKNGVEVWMADANSGRSLLRQLVVDEDPGGPNYNNIALQTAELLRTSLLYEQKGEPALSAAPQTAPTHDEGSPAAEDTAGRNGDAGVQVGLGALYSAGGTSTALEAWLSVHYPLQRWLTVGVELGLPLERGTMSGPEGSTALGVYIAAATLGFNGRSQNGFWFARGGLAAGVLRITTEAHTTPPLETREATSLTALTYARAEGGVSLTPWLRLGVRGLAGFAIPTVRIDFAGNEAGTWGNPLLGALGLLEVPWS